MRRGHKLVHPTGLEMPPGLDPSGVPCEGFGCADPSIQEIVHLGGPLESLVHVGMRHEAVAHAGAPLESVAGVPHPPTGLAPTSMIVSVEAVEVEGEAEWLLWGSVAEGSVLFAVDSDAAAEMVAALRVGEHASAIVEPSQLRLQRLD